MSETASVGKELRLARIRGDVFQEDLAREAGMGRNRLSLLEQGKLPVGQLRLAEVMRLCRETGLSPEIFLAEAGAEVAGG